MDFTEALRKLYAWKYQVEQAIAALEEYQNNPRSSALVSSMLREPKRPGRKGMDSKERKQVSERMKKYWESRREKR